VKRAVPVHERWAHFGTERSKLAHTPRAGVCISAFLIARRGNSILLGLPRMHDSWTGKGGYAKWRLAEPEMQNAWLLPATHLRMEEHPDDAARRISYEWTGLKGKPQLVTIQSHLRRRRNGNHWDLCFVYEMHVRALPKCKPWWSEMRFVRSEEILKMKLGRGHKDILREAGYV